MKSTAAAGRGWSSRGVFAAHFLLRKNDGRAFSYFCSSGSVRNNHPFQVAPLSHRQPAKRTPARSQPAFPLREPQDTGPPLLLRSITQTTTTTDAFDTHLKLPSSTSSNPEPKSKAHRHDANIILLNAIVPSTQHFLAISSPFHSPLSADYHDPPLTHSLITRQRPATYKLHLITSLINTSSEPALSARCP